MSETDDCDAVLGRMHQFLDHELEEADCDEIRAHLDACEPCLDNFDVEMALKQLIQRCCQGGRAPEGLRTRIVASFTEVRVQRHE